MLLMSVEKDESKDSDENKSYYAIFFNSTKSN